MHIKPNTNWILTIITLMLFTSSQASAAEAFWLVTPEEQVHRMNPSTASKSLSLKSLPLEGAPRIELLAPSNKQDELGSPITIKLAFHAQNGARIVPSTLKVMYGLGFLQLDITERLLENAQITEAGLLVQNARLPSGSHSVTVKVQDDQERTGTADYNFVVARI